MNLCIAAGHIGRPGAGPFSLTGQPNAMGGPETGGLARLLPGYRKVASAGDRAEMEALWRLPAEAAGVSDVPGLTATDLFEALEEGRVKAVWIVATNPLVSMPDLERARRAGPGRASGRPGRAYDPTETSAVAHAVLPAAQWPEKEGTMTNSERRVNLIRQAIDPPGDARPDWEIFAQPGRALGWADHFAWETSADVYAEFAALTAGRPCDQAGVRHERLECEGTLQWPCPSASHPGTERLYEDGRFHTASGRAHVAPTEPAELPEQTSDEYPLVLMTGRIASQWHTMTRTGKSRRLMAAEREPFLEIHPADAGRAGVGDGDLARVSSVRGSAVLRVRLDDSLPPGTAFAPLLLSASSAGSAQAALADQGDDALVCSCMAVTRGTIVEAARRDGLRDVDAVGRATRAGTGCGTCRHGVTSLLRDVTAER